MTGKPQTDQTHLHSLSLTGRLSFLMRDTALYGLVQFINKLLLFATFPLLAHHFSPSDFGFIDIGLFFASFVSLLILFGQDSAIARFFYDTEDKRERQQIIMQSFALQLIMMCGICALLWGAQDIVARQMDLSPAKTQALRIILLQQPVLVLFINCQNILKWNFQRVPFVTITLGYPLITLALLMVVTSQADFTLAEIFTSFLIGQALMACLGLFFVREFLVLPRKFQFLRPMMTYAWPIAVVAVAAAFMPLLERFFIQAFAGQDALGLYAAAGRLGMIAVFAYYAFQTAWGPFSLSLYKDETAAQTYRAVLRLYGFGISALVMLLAVSAPLIFMFFDDAYQLGILLVFPIAFAFALESFAHILQLGISLSKKSYLLIYGYVSYVLTGMAGLAMVMVSGEGASLLSMTFILIAAHFVKLLVQSYFAHRAYPIAWDYGHLARLIGLTAMIGCGALIMMRHDYMHLANGLLLVAALWFLGCLMREIRKLWAHRAMKGL